MPSRKRKKPEIPEDREEQTKRLADKLLDALAEQHGSRENAVRFIHDLLAEATGIYVVDVIEEPGKEPMYVIEQRKPSVHDV